MVLEVGIELLCLLLCAARRPVRLWDGAAGRFCFPSGCLLGLCVAGGWRCHLGTGQMTTMSVSVCVRRLGGAVGRW